MSRCRAVAACVLLLALLPLPVLGSGCIVVRPTAPLGLGLGDGHAEDDSRWEYSVTYRYLFSDRHFRGTHEEPERQALGTDVRNSVHTLDHTLSWRRDARWRFAVSLPVQAARRSSLYEHDRVNRNRMQANGIGDLRLMAYRDMLERADDGPMQGITLGIGIKLPTGQDDVKDTAQLASGPARRNVDQSIQPGDGGTGLIIEWQAYREVWNESTFAFLTGSYLINPRNTNGVATHRGRASEAVMSVPDTYQLRTGLTRVLSPANGVSGDLALRLEGVPARDLVGDSDGFRRPGYALYAEPALNAQRGAHRWSVGLPIAIVRNRVTSVPDRRENRHGDAAFADWLLQISYGYRW